MSFSFVSISQEDKPEKTALDYANQYLELGINVIPVGANKRPLLKWEIYQHRKVTSEEVHLWWEKNPNTGIAIVTGAISGVVVLDIDGEEGQRTIKENKLALPPTWVVKTGSEGYHYYFRHPGRTVKNFARKLPGIDLRGDGGYAVAPPSLHQSGKRYMWVIPPGDEELADCPKWLKELIGQQSTEAAIPPEEWRNITGNYILKGQRNTTLTRLAGYLLRRYVDPLFTLNLLLAFNEARCKPPLTKEEVISIVDSIAGRELRRRKNIWRIS